MRTSYSFRSAVGRVDKVIGIVKDRDMPALISDTDSAYGWQRWRKECEKQEVSAAYGIEIAVSPDPEAKKPIYDHWTFYPQEDIRALTALYSMATKQFRYRPLLNYKQALEAPGLFRIIGPRTLINELDGISDDTYVGMVPAISPGYREVVDKAGIPWIHHDDNRYPCLEDRGLWQVVCGRNAITAAYPQHILSISDMQRYAAFLFKKPTIIAEAVENARVSLLQSSRAIPGRATLLIPARRPLRELCVKGAKKLGINVKTGKYAKQLKKELSIIEEKEFSDYFLIVSDIVSWAKEHMVVGPARGSSAGSLVCYLLGITAIDPIKHGLIFERFIDIGRKDLPDIDIDFSDKHRPKVIEYIKQRYGRDKVAQLGTVNTYKPKSAMNTASAALGIPKWRCDAAMDGLIEKSSGDARAQDSLEDTADTVPMMGQLFKDYPELKVSWEVEGLPRHCGRHASAVVLAEQPLNSFAPIDMREEVLMMNKEDAEEIDLLKVDILGLTQLSILQQAMEMAGEDFHKLEELELEDKDAHAILGDRKFAGIFQFNGLALQTLAKRFRMERFDDIVAITALSRPGPLIGGAAYTWVAIRRGDENTQVPHPMFEPYVGSTFGVAIYQEQIMEICRHIGDFSWEEVNVIRYAMSKSKGNEFFDKFGEKWKAAAIEKGLPTEKAKKIWDQLCNYGSWAFNKSHAVAYALISYWCCWVKAHYPFEFAAASLNYESDDHRKILLLRELAVEGYNYTAVDGELSGLDWSIHEVPVEGHPTHKVRKLVGPLTGIRGIGPKYAQTILGARKRNEKLPDGLAKKLANPQTPIDSLYPIRDAYERLIPDPKEIHIVSRVNLISEIPEQEKSRNWLLVVVPKMIHVRDANEPVNVAKRGGEIDKSDFTQYLNMHLIDDSGLIFAKVLQRDYKKIGQQIVDIGNQGKALWAFKGDCIIRPFRIFIIKRIRYLGSMDDSVYKTASRNKQE